MLRTVSGTVLERRVGSAKTGVDYGWPGDPSASTRAMQALQHGRLACPLKSGPP